MTEALHGENKVGMRAARSVTLAGIGQPAARYSASLALKIKNNRE